MSEISNSITLLDEVDARQDEVIHELDRLNQRIEKVLKECLGDGRADQQAA